MQSVARQARSECCGTREGPCVDLFPCHAALNLARVVTLFSLRLAEEFLSEETFSILEFSRKLQAQMYRHTADAKRKERRTKPAKKVRRFATSGAVLLL
jgi:hypothetical protein